MSDKWEDTHGPGTLLSPDEIQPGDLIYYAWGWHPVTHTRVETRDVFVFFLEQGETSARHEWKPYDRRRRARVRRPLA